MPSGALVTDGTSDTTPAVSALLAVIDIEAAATVTVAAGSRSA
jgi:hypothetical protein